jgi:hypothetical protein
MSPETTRPTPAAPGTRSPASDAASLGGALTRSPVRSGFTFARRIRLTRRLMATGIARMLREGRILPGVGERVAGGSGGREAAGRRGDVAGAGAGSAAEGCIIGLVRPFYAQISLLGTSQCSITAVDSCFMADLGVYRALNQPRNLNQPQCWGRWGDWGWWGDWGGGGPGEWIGWRPGGGWRDGVYPGYGKKFSLVWRFGWGRAIVGKVEIVLVCGCGIARDG